MSDGALAEATVRDPGIRVLDLFRMEGSVAIVTGASSGLGVVFADALAEAGADVVLAARRTDRLEATRNRIQRHGRRCLAIPTDVTREDDCVVLVDRVTAELGAVDVLVNNAGVGYMSPAHREAPGQFRAAVETNLIGAHTMAQAVGRRLIEGERPGSIVNVASIIGLSAGDVPQAGYAASKAGVIGLTRDLAMQWSGRYGIRVNALAPGFFRTEMTEDLLDSERGLGAVISRTPMRRVGDASELAGALLLLASSAGSFITGVTLVVDGGWTMH